MLNALLEDWQVADLTIASREGPAIWSVADDGAPEGESVALVTAVRPED
jgi:hypothetical protein